MSEFAPRVRWDRIGRLALLFVGLLLIYLYINPLRTYVSTWQEARAMSIAANVSLSVPI